MKPHTIYLIRHGESASNADKAVQEHTPDWLIPLTQTGFAQANAAGRDLLPLLSPKRYGVYVSPFLRARQTWTAIEDELVLRGRHTYFTREDPRLREQEWGHLRKAERADAIDDERQAYGTFFYRIPDGESGADVYDRCTGFLDTLYRDFEKPNFPDRVLIVTHGFTIRVLLMRWLHWTVEEFHSLANPANCQRFELRLGEDGRYGLEGSFPRRV